MSHRDPRRPFASQPADDGLDPPERPFRARDDARPAPQRPASDRPALDPSGLRRSTGFPWLTDGTDSARLVDDRGETAARQAAVPPRGPDRPGRPSVPADDPTDPAAWTEVTEAWAADTDQGWDDADRLDLGPAPGRGFDRAAASPVAEPAAPRRAPRRAAAPVPARPRAARPPMQLPTVRLPAGFAGSGLLGDRTALTLLGIALLSAAAMALVLSSQLAGLPASLPIHLDAAGRADRFGPPRVLWRLPLLAAMATLLNLVLAWVLARFDRFAARFLLAAALVVQLIAWVALFDFV